MKDKIVKIIMWTIVILVALSLIVLLYLKITDIETKMPNEKNYNCEIEEKRFMDRKVFVITSKNENKSNLKILYFHGGSYMAEATEEHWKFAEKMANDTGATIILPDYPLTPKYNYKDVFKMVVPLYKEIIKSVNVNDLIIMGDSAGGGLSLALVEVLAEKEIGLPNKTILISPWLDVRLTNPKIDEVQKLDKDLKKDALRLAGIAYAGEDGMDSYLVNPIDGDLSKIKNLTIFIGTDDILNPDVYILQERAKSQGTEIDIKEYNGASHIWILKNNKIEQEQIQKAYYDLLEVIKK